MSHDHHLTCRACNATDRAGDWHAFNRVYGGDAFVHQAPAIRELVLNGADFGGGARIWVHFISDHAHCNAFYEVCDMAEYGDPCSEPRRILVKGVAEPTCGSCHGRRLIACPECA